MLGPHSCVAVAFYLCYLSALRVDVTTLCRAIMVKYNIVPTLPSSLSRSLRVVTPGGPDWWDSVDWGAAACLDYSRAKICQSVHGISDSDSPVSSLQCPVSSAFYNFSIQSFDEKWTVRKIKCQALLVWGEHHNYFAFQLSRWIHLDSLEKLNVSPYLSGANIIIFLDGFIWVRTLYINHHMNSRIDHPLLL